MFSTAASASLLEASRVAHGLTQAELSAASGVAQGVISKLESGNLTPDPARMSALAKALGVPVSLIDGTTMSAPHARVFHRKQASLPAKASHKLHADMVLAHVRLSRLLRDDDLGSSIPHLPLPENGLYTPSDRAREVRKMWGLPPGPVPSIVDLLESHGVPCLMWDVSSARVDAIASWPDDATPVILLSSRAPGDRLRFTVAHELGHAVMHAVPCADCERQADEFASEFLMPRKDIKDALVGATLPRLAALKPIWGTSIAALARRARDVGAINDSQYRSLNIELSQSGYRKNEPVHVNPELPGFVERAIAKRLAKGETISQLADDALISVDELQRQYLEVV
ncbi:ImmA/IrrE family metallo-endopeptidase [Microbacterium sp. VKM Ac-2923]|uniref:helix-turn-helix domain-containing protein n=1 Tax=Microbacterium sp. VKM Ac-2923 TaxID=2929476 RepID=UPI001FB2861C|nr:XRE family transcriptional regulator [Microbacterium sp. VKM Ac-2923]MCJ1708429.1 XRE family transcriptional regulator [Microbacterium sp. VKM Ac-2923]